jgi:hypothetical protein
MGSISHRFATPIDQWRGIISRDTDVNIRRVFRERQPRSGRRRRSYGYQHTDAQEPANSAEREGLSIRV